jgi:sugar phosphate isomerase/epimerase
MRPAVTICLVPEARSGPFVFHEGLADGCRRAAAFGFEGVEVFPASADAWPRLDLANLLSETGLSLAAVGTGAGWLLRRLSLCDPDAEVRSRAVRFIAGIIDAAGEFGAPAIVGSMQGRAGGGDRGVACSMLADGLGQLAIRASRHGQPLLYEPLNRYETDLFCHQSEAVDFLRSRGLDGVRLLADLFHMNIEEADLAASLRRAGAAIGHVHFADSNRRAMGLGHTPPEPVVAALRAIGYEGWLSAEVFPLPSADEAARRTVEAIRRAGDG